MAGIAKPNVANLGAEATVSFGASYGIYYRSNATGLINGNTPNEWDTSNVVYWDDLGDYITITINKKVNIWRSGTLSWKTYINKFKILKLNTTTSVFEDVTSNYVQVTSAIINGEWEKTISNLEPGTYRLVATGRRIDSEWYIETAYVNKLLILINGNGYKYDGTSWINLGVIPSSIEERKNFYLQNGMDQIPSQSINYLPDNFTLSVWTGEENANRKLKINAVPFNQLVTPKKDIDIRSVESIDSFTLNTNLGGQGMVKVAVSFDKGNTWHTRKNNAWSEISLEVSTMQIDGMDPTTLNAITSTEWSQLRGASETIRFAYLLSMENETDILEVQDLVSQMDMKGTWKKAVHGSHYDYEYPNNDELLVTIFEGGDYKINY